MHRVLLLALLAGCGAARPTCAPLAPGPLDARPLLWQVDDNLYLFGTFHAAGKADIPPAARAALSRSRVFVSEMEPADPDKVQAQVFFPRGQNLPALLPQDAWFDLRDALATSIREAELRRARPWFAMSLLTGAMTNPPSPTMDEALAELAHARGARPEYLETAGEQLGALADSVSAEDLVQAIRERKQMRCGVAALLAAYRRGDGEAVRNELGEETQSALLDRRNDAWLPKVEAHAVGEPTFVAVGVSHLVGPHGLVSLLVAHGHRVIRVKEGS